MKKDIQKMGMVTPFSNDEGIKNYMSRYVRETLVRKNVPNAELKDIEISYPSIAKFKHDYIPESVRRGDKATKQREKVRTDIFPMLSSGAVTYAAMCGSNHQLYPFDNDGIPPALVYNIDQFSIDLDNKFVKNAVRVGPGAKQMAKGQHIGLKSFSEPVAEFTEKELLVLEEHVTLKIAEETNKTADKRAKEEKAREKLLEQVKTHGFDWNSYDTIKMSILWMMLISLIQLQQMLMKKILRRKLLNFLCTQVIIYVRQYVAVVLVVRQGTLSSTEVVMWKC